LYAGFVALCHCMSWSPEPRVPCCERTWLTSLYPRLLVTRIVLSGGWSGLSPLLEPCVVWISMDLSVDIHNNIFVVDKNFM
jgi:hypothetical protein